MIVFVINSNEYEFKDNLSFLDVKKQLIQKLGLSCSYIDITFDIDKPKRISGKFNLEGRLPRPLDKKPLTDFAFKRSDTTLQDKIKIIINEVNDYKADLPRKPIMSKLNTGRNNAFGRGRGRSLSNPPVSCLERSLSTFDHNLSQQDMKVEPTFSLESCDDFPPLQ